jgi:mRNA-degrading endonuclease RelE of RelBE toxin-antitoxin system
MRAAESGPALNSRLHPDFRRCLESLPPEVRARAREAYRRFQADPNHPGLRFKPLQTALPLWSVRISDSYRAVGLRKSEEEIVWFFIGTHSDYERLLKKL